MQDRRDVILIGGEIKTPPISAPARVEIGRLLRRLQDGASLGMPLSRPMPSIGKGIHEIRVRDAGRNWRVIYRVDVRVVLVVHVFAKTTRATPRSVIDLCKRRLRAYDTT